MKTSSNILSALFVIGLCVSAPATLVNYGWEDGGTVLGVFGVVTGTNTSAHVYNGLASLELTKGDTTTDEGYVAWIKGLNSGDVVTASFWVYDATPATNPSGRIWAHYNDSATDVMVYNGSASGNSTYSGATEWTQLSYSWTIPSSHTGLVIEARAYGTIGAQIWVDDLSVTAPDNATIIVPIPEPATICLLGLGVLGLLRKHPK